MVMITDITTKRIFFAARSSMFISLPGRLIGLSRAMCGLSLLTVLLSSGLAVAAERDLLAVPDQLMIEKQYGGLKPQHSLEDQALTLKWEPNPRQNAPFSSGGFSYIFIDPTSLAGAVLEWEAQGTSASGEPLVVFSVSAYDEAGERCEVHTKSPSSSAESMEALSVVFGEPGDANSGWGYEKGTGDIGRVQKILFTFTAPAAQGGDVIVSAARLTQP